MDILDEEDITNDSDDIDFDINTSAIKPTSGRRAGISDEDEEEEDEIDEDDEESLDDLKATELADLDEDENYLFNMDELEQ